MQDTASVQCPYCGRRCEIELDATISNQQFVTDCEVCCRPFTVHAECELGEVQSVQTTAD